MSHGRPPDPETPETPPPRVDAALPPMVDAGLPVHDAGAPTLDADIEDAGAPDADVGIPDAGVPSGCRIEFVSAGVVNTRIEEQRADDGRSLRSDQYWGSERVATARALEWDEAGRATRIEWIDTQFAVETTFRTEQRVYHPDGRLDRVTIDEAGMPTDQRQFVYEGGWLTEVTRTADGVTRPIARFDADLSARTLRVTGVFGELRVEWDEMGRAQLFHEEIDQPGRMTCDETLIERDAEGNVREQRRHRCDEPVGDVTTRFVYERTPSEESLSVLEQLTLGGFGWNTLRTLGEDRLQRRQGRRGSADGDVMFDDDEYLLYRECGYVPNPRRPDYRFEVVEANWYGWAAPIEDMTDAFRPEFLAYVSP